MGNSREDYKNTPAWRVSAEFLFILGIFFLAGGSPPPDVNEPHYLSRLKHFWQPEWCAGDHFLESPDAHFTMVWATGWATRWLPLTAVAWAGRLLAWGLLAWAWQRLSWRVAPMRWCSVLTAALWVAGMQQWHLAGEWVIGGVESKCFAYALVLFALRDYLDERWIRVWILLGLACSLHALVGAWCLAILFVLWAIYHRDQAPLRRIAPGLVFGAVLALPGVLPPVMMNWGVDQQIVQQANQIYVFDRLPHHLALLSMRPGWLADRALRHLAMLTVLALLTWLVTSRRRLAGVTLTDSDSDALVPLARFAWAAATAMVVGLAIEALLSANPAAASSLLRYYWHRVNDIAAPLAAALMLGAILTAAVRQQLRWAPGLLVVLLGLSGWHLYERLDAGGLRPIPPADRRVADYHDWRDVCRWARSSTPSGAQFLVPKHSQSFRWRAERPEVATWKDIPQNATGLVAWRQRIDDIYTRTGADGEDFNIGSLSELGARRLRLLGDRYGARFVLTDHYRPVSLPVAYRNSTYVVYELSP